MKKISVITLILTLTALPAMAGMVSVQEFDEAANCELRASGLIAIGPDTSVIFPGQTNTCTEAESNERPKSDSPQTDRAKGNSENEIDILSFLSPLQR